MCLPHCLPTVARRLREEPPRRRFLKAAALAPLAAAAPDAVAFAPGQFPQMATRKPFAELVDLTHSFGPEFPTFFGRPGIQFNVLDKQLNPLASGAYHANEWVVNEHAGTHIDAPLHFSEDGLSTDQIPLKQLVAPLAVVDIREKARANPDAEVSPEDLKKWESKNGPILSGMMVAMLSGWGELVHTPEYLNTDENGTMHFPGFHAETAEFLMSEREVFALAVDTLSLDHGPSIEFPVHYDWLPTGRWGLECVAALDKLPAAGTTLFVGAPKVQGATGGQCRLLGLV